MIQFTCDICQRKLTSANINEPYQFCERCQPFAAEFIKGMNDIGIALATQLQDKLKSYRSSFMQNRVVASEKQAALKAV